MGQRGAAEATRRKFNLEAFSHSTVSRSFRSFEHARKHSLERRFGAEIAVNRAEYPMLIKAAAGAGVREGPGGRLKGRFPGVADTSERRAGMRGFFPVFPSGERRAAVEGPSIAFVEKWHRKTRRLLL